MSTKKAVGEKMVVESFTTHPSDVDLINEVAVATSTAKSEVLRLAVKHGLPQAWKELRERAEQRASKLDATGRRFPQLDKLNGVAPSESEEAGLRFPKPGLGRVRPSRPISKARAPKAHTQRRTARSAA